MFSRKKQSPKSSRQNDWVTSTANAIEGLIDTARSVAVDKVTIIVRAVVYGLLAVVVGVPALVLVGILMVRLLQIYLGNIPGTTHHVWLADFVVGAIFIVAGLFMWSKRSPKSTNG